MPSLEPQGTTELQLCSINWSCPEPHVIHKQSPAPCQQRLCLVLSCSAVLPLTKASYEVIDVPC